MQASELSMSFNNLKLSAPLLKAITESDYKNPTPIQAEAIPVVLSGKDLLARAQTGTGKTASYTLPLLHRLDNGRLTPANTTRALILVPTRELAIQVGQSIQTYGKHCSVRCVVAYGGVKINPQMMRLRRGTDILVATPGRLLDLYEKNAVRFSPLETLVLDEADRMLDLGFAEELGAILQLLPQKRQTLLFSATFAPAIRHLAKQMSKTPVEVEIASKESTVPAVKQWMIPVDKKSKPELLLHLLEQHQWSRALVFVLTKKGADRMVTFLQRSGIVCAAIHGDKSQRLRTKALEDFKAHRIAVLVATDVAARGLDIDAMPVVLNADLPIVASDYIHRVGRTARAGASGEAISLVCADEHKQLINIEQLLGQRIRREYESGFEPGHEVPESPSPTRPIKPKKPKKNKKVTSKKKTATAKTSTNNRNTNRKRKKVSTRVKR